MPAPGLRKRVDPVRGEPSPYGLLGSCADVVYTDDVHELNGTDTTGTSCADSNTWRDCPTETDPPNPASKVFDRPRSCSYAPITVYSGVTCSTFGMSYEEGQAHALESLRLGEGRALEEFYQTVLCGYATGNDLTPAAGALSVTAGIGALENWLAVNYGGRGVLHVPAGAAAMLSRDQIVDRETRETLMGNCVVLGSGYAANVGPATLPATGCTVAPAGEMWAYITPPVRVRRDQPYLAVANEGQSVNTSTNDRRALAESTFVVETSCCMAAAVRLVIC